MRTLLMGTLITLTAVLGCTSESGDQTSTNNGASESKDDTKSVAKLPEIRYYSMDG